MSKLKLSANQYRNIAGVHYECWTSNPLVLKAEKQLCKKLGLKYRIIDGQFYRERLENPKK